MASATAVCEQSLPQRVFFQPWNLLDSHAVRLDGKLLHQLQLQGYSHLILQWSRRGDTEFWPDDGRGWIRQALVTDKSLQIIHGLYSDPNYFDILNKTDSRLDIELAAIRDRSINEAAKLIKQSPVPIAGWYLPEEIDDLNWQTAERQQMLSTHFLKTIEQLHNLYPVIPVYASVFFSGNQDPVSFAKMLEKINKETGIIWLIQDGLGEQRHNKIDTTQYLHSITQSLPPQAWQGVLEIFSEQSHQTRTGIETEYCPASKYSIQKRITTWCEATGKNPEVIFSLTQLRLPLHSPFSNRCKKPLWDR
ncbi:DUF4434 domain-containing protein [Glaciimonas soli]|uniref:DUF4434 domain-containing protein n=1 Tax=Glaciimonas soli TaxID=2590999 RepID=A0A843YTX3_9BURK|nr:DUF4434 domain-containing protein [Glaciimonas soli]MQR01154.1 DUF4434 domain-containing protein [Glaciimonas soli]